VNDKADDKPNDKPEKEKSKFNWITERSACTLPKVFKEFRLQVEEDVKTRNALRPNNSPYEFSVAEKRDDKGNPMFQVTLTFNDKGECKLHANEQEREFWQVRRMALEELLFRSN